MGARGQRNFRIFILVVGGFALLFSIAFPFVARRILRPARQRDYEQAKPQQGEATVSMLIPARPDPLSGKPGLARVLVRFQGKIYEPKQVFGLAELKESRPARVVYRVGTSGIIYLDSVEPLPPQ